MRMPVSYQAQRLCKRLTDFGKQDEINNSRRTGGERTTESSTQREVSNNLHAKGNEGSRRKDHPSDEKTKAKGTYDWTDRNGYSFF